MSKEKINLDFVELLRFQNAVHAWADAYIEKRREGDSMYLNSWSVSLEEGENIELDFVIPDFYDDEDKYIAHTVTFEEIKSFPIPELPDLF